MSQDGRTSHFSRRGLMAAAGAGGIVAADMHFAEAKAQVCAPLKSLGADAKGITIKNITTFDVVVPQPPGRVVAVPYWGLPGRINVTCVETNAGIRGYSFGGNYDQGTPPQEVRAAQALLAGQDLFAVEAHLKRGLNAWAAVEEAIWDAIGKIAGQPVCRLLGGASLTSVPVYVTYSWPGDMAQNDVTPREQSRQAPVLRQAGIDAMKIRVWRKDYHVDAEAVSECLAAGGSGFRVMVDRTARKHKLWTYEEGLAAARALQQAGCFWLEEPFAQDDYEGPARLAREVDILITGGEGYHTFEPFRQCLEHGTYEILQPELHYMGGVLNTRKVGVLAEAWGLKVAPHGTSGLGWAGRLQSSAAMVAHSLEIAVLTPPLLPQDYCTPFLPLLHGEQPFIFKDGGVLVPRVPGLGLNIDEKALARYRVDDLQLTAPPPPPPHKS
jgi:L-alanine-DL-glutamate epimerase-like enolase superfamily enzyme